MMFLQNFLKRFMLTLLVCMLNILPPKFDYNIATHNLNENKISVK